MINLKVKHTVKVALMVFKGLNITGVLTKTIVATKERLEGVRGEEGEGALEAVTPAQQRREMELVRKEVYIYTLSRCSCTYVCI